MIINPFRSFVTSGRLDSVSGAKFDSSGKFKSSSIVIRCNASNYDQSRFFLLIFDEQIYNDIVTLKVGDEFFFECKVAKDGFYVVIKYSQEPIYAYLDLLLRIFARRNTDLSKRDDDLYKACLESMNEFCMSELAKFSLPVHRSDVHIKKLSWLEIKSILSPGY